MRRIVVLLLSLGHSLRNQWIPWWRCLMTTTWTRILFVFALLFKLVINPSKFYLITCTFCTFISNVVKRAPKNSRKQTLGGLSSSFCQKNSLWKGFVLTKPHSKSFSICPTILSKHHLLWTVLWKHLEKTGKAFIFLKQPTKEEIWRFKYSVNRCLS